MYNCRLVLRSKVGSVTFSRKDIPYPAVFVHLQWRCEMWAAADLETIDERLTDVWVWSIWPPLVAQILMAVQSLRSVQPSSAMATLVAVLRVWRCYQDRKWNFEVHFIISTAPDVLFPPHHHHIQDLAVLFPSVTPSIPVHKLNWLRLRLRA